VERPDVRGAVMADGPAIAALSGQLGYPVAADELAGRLRRFLSLPDDHAVLVAVGAGSQVVGWIHVGRRETLEMPPRV
jgi:hypothetical protein